MRRGLFKSRRGGRGGLGLGRRLRAEVARLPAALARARAGRMAGLVASGGRAVLLRPLRSWAFRALRRWARAPLPAQGREGAALGLASG